MWPTVDLVTFTEEALHGKLHILSKLVENSIVDID